MYIIVPIYIRQINMSTAIIGQNKIIFTDCFLKKYITLYFFMHHIMIDVTNIKWEKVSNSGLYLFSSCKEATMRKDQVHSIATSNVSVSCLNAKSRKLLFSFFLIVIIILKACKFNFYYRFIGGISMQHQIDPLSKISGSLTGGIVLLPPFSSTLSFLVKGTSPIFSNFFIVIEFDCYYLMSFKRFIRINAMIASFHSNRLILQYISSDVVLNMRSVWQPPPQR